MAASYRTTGIILGRTNLGEADRIITVLTPDRGKLRAVARGVRKIKSRVAGHIEPFSRVDLGLAVGHSLDVVTSARLVEYPRGLADDFDRLGCAFLVSQIIDRLLPENTPQPGGFELLQTLLAGLRRPLPTSVAELFFKLQFLSLLGYQLQLERCVGCGAVAVVALSAERGGGVCAACRVAEPPFSERQFKLWRLVHRYDLATLQRIADVEAIARETLGLCDDVYGYHFGRQFTRPRPTAQGAAQ